jgi:putative pyoverdin transport system ATP-binding/permease protein
MRLLRQLIERGGGTLAVAVVANLLNAAASGGLMAVLHAMLAPRGDGAALPLGYAALLGVLFASGLVSQIALVRMAARAAYEIRLGLARGVLALPLARLEQLGGERIYACLTQDVTAVSSAWIALPVGAFHAAVLLGGSLYLLWLSPVLFAVMAAALAAGILAYQRIATQGRLLMTRFREGQDRLYAHFDALVRGAKELRSNPRRAEQLLRDDLEPDSAALRDLQAQAFSAWALGNNWGNVLTLAAVGLLLVASRVLGRDLSEEALGGVLAVLFLRAHLGNLLSSVPAVVQGDVSLRKIESLGLAEPGAPATPAGGTTGHAEHASDWKRLSLSGVTYRYGSSTQSFVLGPLDVEIARGEIVFVTGGNGSGKSTFVKLLTGLYVPERGELRLDSEPVDPTSAGYRSRFSAIFADYYLFARLSTRGGADVQQRARQHLAELGLARKLDASAERLALQGLSAGERRRLALVAAYLEGGQIHVFDEWAADQDPHYRAAFYHEILPALRARGATVVVITHDDRYFGCADRLLRFEEGQARWQSAVEPPAPRAEAG